MQTRDVCQNGTPALHLEATGIQLTSTSEAARSPGLFPAADDSWRGQTPLLVLLYETHAIGPFPTVGDFLSYARLVTPKQSSDGKGTGHGGAKIGNPHLTWAFS
jgi:hypothetical protein